MKKMDLNAFLTGAFGMALICVILYGHLIHPKLGELKRMKERQEEISEINLRESGGGCLYTPPGWEEEYFNYDIRSWDAGKNWYVVERDEDWGIRIIGDARELYPGLLEHIRGMEALTKYVTEKGSIDGSDPEGLEALRDAGFIVTVEIKENDSIPTK